MKKILMPTFINDAGKRFLMDCGYEIVFSEETPRALLAHVSTVDGILTAYGNINHEILSAAPQLKVVAKYGVGVDNIDCTFAAKQGIWVVNTPGANANAVAEYTLGVILALSRHTIALDRLMKNLGWQQREEYIGTELAGKTLGIVGLGQVGRLVAQKAIHGFGMHVLGYDRYVDPSRLDPAISMCDNMDTLFTASDFLTLHAPASEETYHLINETALSLMKPTACLINASRGPLVDETALYQALKERRIQAAAIDAYAEEPLRHPIPLLELPNVITTPHIAFQTHEAMEKMSLQAAQGIDEVLQGKKPTYSVNTPL